MYCTNCHKINHNVETCRIKRKEDHVPAVYEVDTQQIKVQRLVRYSCHICGDTRPMIVDYPKYSGMHNIFKDKRMNIVKKPSMVEPKVTNPLIHLWWMSTWPSP